MYVHGVSDSTLIKGPGIMSPCLGCYGSGFYYSIFYQLSNQHFTRLLFDILFFHFIVEPTPVYDQVWRKFEASGFEYVVLCV